MSRTIPRTLLVTFRDGRVCRITGNAAIEFLLAVRRDAVTPIGFQISFPSIA